ncbi:exopolysaccharide biosynthesis polyprenyl glycosylphosphotransferase [Erythrobacter sp. GH1-10]|uniref:exopolysaccharide biosynthesis polyprenyl glycosylphosphotransferase n=1 Tax=Erythrobacter sp. GH1-10 TaxID=3349334 RepID=UPI003877BE0B
MHINAVPKPRQKAGNLLFSGNLQLPAYLMAALTPPIVWWVGQGQDLRHPILIATLIPLAVAVLVTWYILSRLREYARTRHLSYVFPVNFLAFAGVLSGIAILRVAYSIPMFGMGAFGTVLFSYISTAHNRGLRRPHFIVGGGRSSEVRIEGQYLPAPSLIELETLVQARQLNGALVADLHYDHPDEWERLFAKAALAGIPVYHYRQVAEMQTGQVKITHLSENELGSLIPNVPYVATKRLIDIVGSVLLLPLLAVPLLVIALLIKLDSKGPVLFVQERVGFRGRTFRMVKFRTMRERAAITEEEALRNDAMTRDGDDRITRVGQFLRKTRIDELPQVLNILRGEMSWIGPRPEAESLAKWYESELPFYSYRHIVRPGITGWAQVNQGHVTDVSDVNAKLRFDFYYVKNISLWLDFLIVLKTFRVILTGNGAK